MYLFQVMDFDTVGRNELIGKLCLGCEYNPQTYNEYCLGISQT
jgi:hypothetical protein